MATTISTSGNRHTITGLSTSQSSDKLPIPSIGGAIGCVSVVSGGGTGFNSGTVTIQASIDGTNWFGLKDLSGTAITFTAAGYAEFSTAALYIRATNDGSVSDVDVDFVLKA